MAGTRVRNPRGSGGALRDEILAAAIRVVDGPGGAAGLTLRGVARAAGISAPSIYPHFEDVTALTEAVLASGFQELARRVEAALAGWPDDPAAALAAGCTAYVEFGWAHRARYRLMFAANGFAPDAVRTFELVERAISRCVASGVSTSSDAHADTFLLWVALHGIATLQKPSRTEYLRLGPIDRPAAVLALVDRLARIDRGGR